MGRSVAPDVEVDPLQARHELSLLAGFAAWPIVTDAAGAAVRPEARDLPVQAALRELQARHGVDPLAAVEAHRDALAVVDAHPGAAAALARFRASRACGAGYWPTLDAKRIRAV